MKPLDTWKPTWRQNSRSLDPSSFCVGSCTTGSSGWPDGERGPFFPHQPTISPGLWVTWVEGCPSFVCSHLGVAKSILLPVHVDGAQKLLRSIFAVNKLPFRDGAGVEDPVPGGWNSVGWTPAGSWAWEGDSREKGLWPHRAGRVLPPCSFLNASLCSSLPRGLTPARAQRIL